MADFVFDEPVDTGNVATVEVTGKDGQPLAIGQYKFRLVVVDDEGNESLPSYAKVEVSDPMNPTARLNAPSKVKFGKSFFLNGKESSDVAPGTIVRYIWTLLE